MTPIPHKYFAKLRNEVSEFEQWLANTEANEAGAIKPEDLQGAFVRITSLYTKTLELYRIGSNPPESHNLPDDGPSEPASISRG
jgi:hypothetical protein